MLRITSCLGKGLSELLALFGSSDTALEFMAPCWLRAAQDCNARAEARFHEILAADREMTGSGALLAARDVWSHAYRSPLIERGYAKTGIVAGKPLQPNVLLVDRAASLLRSNVPKEDVALETQEAQQLLKGIYSMPNKTEARPSSLKCGAYVTLAAVVLTLFPKP